MTADRVGGQLVEEAEDTEEADILPTGGLATLVVDDANLPSGSAPNAAVMASALSFTAGSEALTSSLSVCWQACTRACSGFLADGTILTGSDERGPVIQLTLFSPGTITANSTGTVSITVELLANFDTHPGLIWTTCSTSDLPMRLPSTSAGCSLWEGVCWRVGRPATSYPCRKCQRSKTINQYTRYLTVLLAVFQAYGISIGLELSGSVVSDPGIFFRIRR